MISNLDDVQEVQHFLNAFVIPTDKKVKTAKNLNEAYETSTASDPDLCFGQAMTEMIIKKDCIIKYLESRVNATDFDENPDQTLYESLGKETIEKGINGSRVFDIYTAFMCHHKDDWNFNTVAFAAAFKTLESKEERIIFLIRFVVTYDDYINRLLDSMRADASNFEVKGPDQVQ